MNKRVLLVGALVAIPFLFLLRLGLDNDPNIVETPLLGTTATQFVLADFEGRTLDSKSLEGRPVVLNFWASWCQPCVYEHPHLVQAARDYAGRAHFVGVVPPEDKPEAVAAFERRLGSWGPALHDSDGRVAIAFGVFKLPETYVIDSEGVIREKFAGPVDPRVLRQILETLL